MFVDEQNLPEAGKTDLQWNNGAVGQLLAAINTAAMMFTTGSDPWLQQYAVHSLLSELDRDVIVIDAIGCSLVDLGTKVRQTVAKAISEAAIERGQAAWLILQHADHLISSLEPYKDVPSEHWLARIFCTELDLRVVIPTGITVPHAIDISFSILRPAKYISRHVQVWLRQAGANMAQRMSVDAQLAHMERGIEHTGLQLDTLLEDLLPPLLDQLGGSALTLASLHCLSTCIHALINAMLASGHLKLTSAEDGLLLPLMRSVLLATFHWAYACGTKMATTELTLFIDQCMQGATAFRGHGVASLVSSELPVPMDLASVQLAAGSGTLRRQGDVLVQLSTEHQAYAQLHAYLLAAGHSVVIAGKPLSC
jgi:hypothetical protein